MKKNLLNFLLAGCLTLGSFSGIYSQLSSVNNAKFNQTEIMAASRVFVASESDRAALQNMKKISAKMFDKFSKSFADASDILITPVDGQFRVNCMTNNSKNILYFSKKGKLQQSIRYYKSSMLPQDVVFLVRNDYPEYTISSEAVEVTVGKKTGHIVTIENCTRIKKLKVVDGEMEVYEEFEKG